jgi:regulatory protein
MNEITEEQALARLTAACARAEHCMGEMYEKMRRWGIEADAQERISTYLKEHRYIDDERFARLFVRDKMQFNKWGRRKIEQALWAKQVDETIYKNILDEIDQKEWNAILLPALQTKKKSIKAATPYEAYTKLVRFAMSRGFTMDIIKACIGEEP